MLVGSAPLVSFAEDCGATVVGRFYSAERAVSRAEEKRHLSSSADAVEMESFAVLSRARANGVPGVAIRCVSDTVDEDLPLDMNEVFNERRRREHSAGARTAGPSPAGHSWLGEARPKQQARGGIAGGVPGSLSSEFSKRAKALESNSVGLPS